MAGMVFRKMGVILLIILKWILQAVFTAVKLVFSMAELFLQMLILVMRVALKMAGIFLCSR